MVEIRKTKKSALVIFELRFQELRSQQLILQPVPDHDLIEPALGCLNHEIQIFMIWMGGSRRTFLFIE